MRADALADALDQLAALLAAAKERAEQAESENQKTREVLWLGHGHPAPAIYGDDGEMQCHACAPVWDYKRLPLPELAKQAMKASAEARLAAVRETLDAKMALFAEFKKAFKKAPMADAPKLERDTVRRTLNVVLTELAEARAQCDGQESGA